MVSAVGDYFRVARQPPGIGWNLHGSSFSDPDFSGEVTHTLNRRNRLQRGIRSGRSRKNTALLEGLAVHKPFKPGTGLELELIATLFQVAPQNRARLEFARLTVSRLRIKRLKNCVKPSHGGERRYAGNCED